MARHGWTLLFHTELIRQLGKLEEASERAQRKDPHGLGLILMV